VKWLPIAICNVLRIVPNSKYQQWCCTCLTRKIHVTHSVWIESRESLKKLNNLVSMLHSRIYGTYPIYHMCWIRWIPCVSVSVMTPDTTTAIIRKLIYYPSIVLG